MNSVLLLCGLWLGVCMASTRAAAQGFIHEIKGGLLLHDMPEMWSGFRLEHRAVDLNLELALIGVPVPFGTLRPVLGGSFNTRGDTSHAYLDARYEVELPLGLFFATGLGIALHDGLLAPTEMDRKALGSRALFHIPFELGLRITRQSSISVYFEHTSNAGLANYNEGMDRLGVRYGYRF